MYIHIRGNHVSNTTLLTIITIYVITVIAIINNS